MKTNSIARIREIKKQFGGFMTSISLKKIDINLLKDAQI
jgi:hypothetical protein